MPIDRVLSQEEIDSVFRNVEHPSRTDAGENHVLAYDFRRPDRIAKDQLRAIQLLHDNFARSLASSLSAYLRAYVTVNLVSVEQLSFVEFVQCLPSPSVITSLGMKPFEGNAVLELDPAVVFPVIEILLGGTGKGSSHHIDREVTEIETSILDSVYRLILRDMKMAWEGVARFEFTIEGRETEPQMLALLAPSEAVVAVSLEVRIAESVGMINIGIPSIVIKMLRQKFDSQWLTRKAESSEQEQQRILRLLQPASLRLDARLSGPTIRTKDLLRLECGDILKLDYDVNRQLGLTINNILKWQGQAADNGRKRCFVLESKPEGES